MNLINLIFFTLLSVSLAFSQQLKKRPYFFNEGGLYVHFSHPVYEIAAVEGAVGIVAGAYHSYTLEKRVNPVLGVEYNYMRFTAKELYNSKLQTDINAQYHLFKVPFTIRIYPGGARKFFLEPGIYGVAPLANSYMTTTTVFEDGEVKVKQIKDRFSSTPGVGFSFGLGGQIPVPYGALLLKADACWGIGKILLASGNSNESTILYSPGLKIGLIYQLDPIGNRLF